MKLFNTIHWHPLKQQNLKLHQKYTPFPLRGGHRVWGRQNTLQLRPLRLCKKRRPAVALSSCRCGLSDRDIGSGVGVGIWVVVERQLLRLPHTGLGTYRALKVQLICCVRSTLGFGRRARLVLKYRNLVVLLHVSDSSREARRHILNV